MNTDKHLQFISSKIVDLNAALFNCHANSVLKLPTSIVYTMKVDEQGNIFIFMPRPKQLISQFEKEFPVGLNYFRKGVSHYLNIYGKARIINDPEELNSYDLTFEEINQALNTDLLIIVKILKADYYEKDLAKKNSILHKVKSFMYSLLALVERDEKSYDFSAHPTMQGYGF